jgi:hypothetical protein
MTHDVDNWQPMPVEDAADLMTGVRIPWWIAGGWAIDLFLGRQTREHGDTDVLIRRDDQLVVQDYLSGKGLLLHKTKQPGLKPWPQGEYLAPPVNDVWCRWSTDTPWVLQLMLLHTEAGQWVFKGDQSIRGPLETLGRRTPSGIPYMRPEIQLLYKAKPDVLAKDQSDFDLAVQRMQPPERSWLLTQLQKRFADSHPWIGRLKDLT